MNYRNFARPEASLVFLVDNDGNEFDREQAAGYPCEECGALCDGTFCSQACEDDAHVMDDARDCEAEDDGQPTEYEEWQDFNGGDDWDHGQYDGDY